jgi:predicted GIY-YIG superfamily endonuclease
MTHKIYLIKHLDTGMGYVGITGDELGKRWYQHLHDPKGALYTALRAEGHRMTMELIEEVETREEALAKEQQYIHALGTAQPAGWNRDVRPLKVEKPKAKPKNWLKITDKPIFSDQWNFMGLECPVCQNDFLHQQDIEIFVRGEDQSEGLHVLVDFTNDKVFADKSMRNNPSSRRQGLRVYLQCESCHNDWLDTDINGEPVYAEDGQLPPLFELLISQHKGHTHLEFAWYIEDKS